MCAYLIIYRLSSWVYLVSHPDTCLALRSYGVFVTKDCDILVIVF
jgi:hypothetical protein